MEQRNELEGIIGWRKTISFALPSILMMLFISSYSLVDGAFVSNLIGTDALASLNILMPLASVMTGIGFMFATGGSAYVANLLGKGEVARARGSLSTIVFFAVFIGILLTLFGMVFIEPLVELLGADEVLFDGSVEYGRAFLLFTVPSILQFIFTQMLIVAGRPGLSLFISVAGGLTNIVLDYVFIGLLDLGLTGAAVASGMGSMIPCLVGLYMFCRKDMILHFVQPIRESKVVISTCTNGVSEMASELSGGITTLLYNLIMMKYVGPDGVSAITVMMYVQFFAIAAIIGYSNGVAPVMSYNHGKGDGTRMNSLYRISAVFVIIVSIAIFLIMEVFGGYIVGFFVEDSENVMSLATDGAKVFSFAFLMMGFNVYASSLFTSLSNGPVSALISVVRSILLLAPLIVLLPMMFGIDAIWYAVPLTEFVTVLLSVFLILRLGKGYGFLKSNAVM